MDVKINYSTDRVGTEGYTYVRFPDYYDDDAISEYAENVAFDNYELYCFEDEDRKLEGDEFDQKNHYAFSWEIVESIPDNEPFADES